MAEFWQKAKEFIGLEEEKEESGEENSSRVEQVMRLRNNRKSSENSESEEGYEIVIYEPKVYEDSLSISTKLRQGCPVLVNLKSIESAEGTRLIDFVCGTAYAIDGHMFKIAESIFLFTPNHILITDMEERPSVSRGIEGLGQERGTLLP